MARVGVFVDISNIYFTVKKKHKGRKMDYQKFLLACTEGHTIVHAAAYGAQENGQARTFIHKLQGFGFTTNFKAPKYVARDVKKADWDVGLAIDVVRMLPGFDTVILGSADSDFAPLVDHCHRHDVRVEVWGSLISKELKANADKIVEITEDLLTTKKS